MIGESTETNPTKNSRGVENMTYDRLKDLDLFRREQTEARHDNNCQVCRRLLQGEGNELSPVPNGLRQRVMGLNCTKGISHLGGCGISVTRGFEE